jgi:hypothetical protein
MRHTSWTVDQSFFCQTKFSIVSNEQNFYLSFFLILCCFLYVHLICVYFKVQKTHHHSIILNFIIQSHSITPGYQLVIFMQIQQYIQSSLRIYFVLSQHYTNGIRLL